MPLVYGLLLIVGLTVFYSYSFHENKDTPVPEGCSHLLANCGTCQDVACGHYDTNRKEHN